LCRRFIESLFLPCRFLVRRLPSRSPLFPYTTLFRSAGEVAAVVLQVVDVDVGDDGDQRVQAQGAAVALVGLGHQPVTAAQARVRSEEHTSELQSRENLVCRLLLEKKNKKKK